MSNAIANPLQSLIAQAAQQQSAGEASRFRHRQQSGGDEIVVLADLSSSMAESAGVKSKYQILKDALSSVMPHVPSARLIAFNGLPSFLADPAELPLPSGSTGLHHALDAAASLRPGRTLVISDGRPDSKEAALDAADRLTGRIDVIYCGPEDDYDAISFLQQLARSTGGGYHGTRATDLIEPVRRLLLLTE